MLLDIGLFKKQNKTKQKTKTKPPPPPPKKRNQNCIKSGLSQFPISTTKDVICCSNGYNYHFLDYIKLLLFVNANAIIIIIIIIMKTGSFIIFKNDFDF